MDARYVCTTAATLKPLSIDEIAERLNVTNRDDFPILAQMLDEAVDAFQRRTQRQLLTATWKLYLDGFPDVIELERLPVASITSITYVNTDGTTTTLAATEYQTDLTDGRYAARICPAYGTVWPAVRGDTLNAVIVTFVAGYTSAALVPSNIKRALLLMIGHYFENREPTGGDAVEVPYTLSAALAAEDWGPSV